jgi:hypothetical protein
MPKKKGPPRKGRVEVRMSLEHKALFESLCGPLESMSDWLYIAGLERAQRMQRMRELAGEPPPVPDPVPPPAPPPPPPPPKKRPRPKR